MPSISYDAFASWSNYHLTLGPKSASGMAQGLRVEEGGRVHADDPPRFPGLEKFAASGGMLRGHVLHVLERMAIKVADPVDTLMMPYAAGLVARGWSFAALIGNATSQLDCLGLTGCCVVDPADRHPDCKVPVGHLTMVGGGTRLRGLLDWAATLAPGLAVPTSGTHLGPSLAGVVGTSSHGSRLGYGGIQNMVHGMHLITGSREHVWLERRSKPVLTDAAVGKLESDRGVPIRIVRNDEMFDDALVHLGGMGIVNCLALELVDDTTFSLLMRDQAVGPEWLEDLAHGRFDSIASWLGGYPSPDFYEVTLDPHAWDGAHALHTMYLPANALVPTGTAAAIVRPADAIARLAGSLAWSGLIQLDVDSLVAEERLGSDLQAILGDEVPMRYFIPETLTTSVFEYYRELAKFDPPPPLGTARHWSELHRDEISGGLPGALYNASFAIERTRLPVVIPAICHAVKDLAKLFVFTIRFVSEPDGTLAFTRFEENAVIEIDGLSELACMVAIARLRASGNPDPAVERQLFALRTVLERGAMAIRAALDAASIPYSMHWAKLGNLDKAKVLADFGDPVSDPHSSILRWRKTRDALLGPEGRALFWNDALVDYGILDRPTQLPPLPQSPTAA